MGNEIRAEICLGNEFNHRGEDSNKEVYLIRKIHEDIKIAPKYFGLEVIKKEVVLPDGKTSGMRYETTYNGTLLLGNSRGTRGKDYKMFNLQAITKDCPHQYGHNVFLRENLDIELPFEQTKGKIELVDALLSPSGIYHDCAIRVPDKESFLEALSNRGYNEDNLSSFKSVVNVDESSLGVSEVAYAVGKYL